LPATKGQMSSATVRRAASSKRSTTLVTDDVLLRLVSADFAHESSAVDINPDVWAQVERSKTHQHRLAVVLEDYSTDF
jgi:hypothetical protein